jgi:hypothetical protein
LLLLILLVIGLLFAWSWGLFEGRSHGVVVDKGLSA